MGSKIHYAAVPTIILMVFTLYGNIISAPFIWDDHALILNNDLIKNIANLPKLFTTHLSATDTPFYRPMQNLSYMGDFFFFKRNPAGYHLVNITLHAAAALLAFYVLLAITADPRLSLGASTLFAASPLWVESVTYISGRADLLMGVFLLLSFLWFIKKHCRLALGAYALALLSKEAALIYPFFLIFYTLTLGVGENAPAAGANPPRQKNKKHIAAIAGYFIVTFLYLAWRYCLAGVPEAPHYTYPLSTRILESIKATGQYLSLLLFPHSLHMSYTLNPAYSFYDIQIAASLSLISLFAALFIYYLKRLPRVSFFIGWFFIFLIPQLSVFIVNAFFAEHFVYLSSLGIFALSAYLLGRLKNKAVSGIILAGWLLFFSVSTIHYNRAWCDPVKFYERIIRLSPGSFVAYNNLGVLTMEQGNLEKGAELIKKSIALSPQYPDALLNLSRYYQIRGDYPRAIGLAQNALRQQTGNTAGLLLLGSLYMEQNNYPAAEKNFQKARTFKPYDQKILTQLYIVYAAVNDEEKIAEIETAIKKTAGNVPENIYVSAAGKLMESGRFAQAILHADKALKINPRESDYHNLKGLLLKRQGKIDEAAVSFRRAIALSPKNFAAYNNLGIVLALMNNLNDAEINFKKSISINGKFADAYFNLGLLYFEKNNRAEAARLFQKALQLEPEHGLARQYLERLAKITACGL